MTQYEELLASLRTNDQEKAENLEEEVNILVHKLKFLPKENFPKALIIDQKSNFESVDTASLVEKINLAGGKFTSDIEELPNVIIILQNDHTLYSVLPLLLAQNWIKNTPAFKNNSIFIIQTPSFDRDMDNFLKETEILAEILQPKYFYFGHEGLEWTKFDLHG